MTSGNGSPGNFHISMPKRTFWQRLRSMALWWGVPSVIVELFWIPRELWLYALIFLIPATAVGVVTGALILHAVAGRRNNLRIEAERDTATAWRG